MTVQEYKTQKLLSTVAGTVFSAAPPAPKSPSTAETTASSSNKD